MKYLVVDSGPLIKGARLERMGAERFVTVPEVLGELRDSHARALLESLPFELEMREPSDEAMKAGAPRRSARSTLGTRTDTRPSSPPRSDGLCKAHGRPAGPLVG